MLPFQKKQISVPTRKTKFLIIGPDEVISTESIQQHYMQALAAFSRLFRDKDSDPRLVQFFTSAHQYFFDPRKNRVRSDRKLLMELNRKSNDLQVLSGEDMETQLMLDEFHKPLARVRDLQSIWEISLHSHSVNWQSLLEGLSMMMDFILVIPATQEHDRAMQAITKTLFLTRRYLQAENYFDDKIEKQIELVTYQWSDTKSKLNRELIKIWGENLQFYYFMKDTFPKHLKAFKQVLDHNPRLSRKLDPLYQKLKNQYRRLRSFMIDHHRMDHARAYAQALRVQETVSEIEKKWPPAFPYFDFHFPTQGELYGSYSVGEHSFLNLLRKVHLRYNRTPQILRQDNSYLENPRQYFGDLVRECSDLLNQFEGPFNSEIPINGAENRKDQKRFMKDLKKINRDMKLIYWRRFRKEQEASLERSTWLEKLDEKIKASSQRAGKLDNFLEAQVKGLILFQLRKIFQAFVLKQTDADFIDLVRKANELIQNQRYQPIFNYLRNQHTLTVNGRNNPYGSPQEKTLAQSGRQFFRLFKTLEDFPRSANLVHPGILERYVISIQSLESILLPFDNWLYDRVMGLWVGVAFFITHPIKSIAKLLSRSPGDYSYLEETENFYEDYWQKMMKRGVINLKLFTINIPVSLLWNLFIYRPIYLIRWSFIEKPSNRALQWIDRKIQASVTPRSG